MLESAKMKISSALNPPDKDNYFFAVGITPHNLTDEKIRKSKSVPKDVILFGVTRPIAGKSSTNDKLLYGYIPRLAPPNTSMNYVDIEFMHHYFGNKVHPTFPSATYSGAPLSHDFNLDKWFSEVLQVRMLAHFPSFLLFLPPRFILAFHALTTFNVSQLSNTTSLKSSGIF